MVIAQRLIRMLCKKCKKEQKTATEEYKKLDSLDIEHDGDNIKLHLKSKSGEKIAKSEITRCLDFTDKQLVKNKEK